MKETAGICRHIEKEKRVASYAFIIYLEELLDALNLVVLRLSPEPARTDGHVCLGCHPCISVSFTLVENIAVGRAARSLLAYIHGTPACTSGTSVLVSYPAASGTHIAEDDGIRLHLVYCRIEERPVVGLFLAVRAFTAGAVEPLFEHLSIAAEGMLKRLHEHVVIVVRSIVGIVSVPRRDIDSELEPVLLACLREFLEHVALSVSPAALGHCMPAYRIWPEAETVMMLGSDYDTLHAGSLCGSSPLTAIQCCRVEDIRYLRTIAPLCTGKSVRSEVDEHIVLHLLPFNLRLSRQGAIWLRSLDTVACSESCQRKANK